MKANMEQTAIQGLELEAIEKVKSAERKALTRKNGLKQEDAKYIDGITGQTRDIVAKKLNMSGKHWDRIKYIYKHKEECNQQEYEAWNNGHMSTSKLYLKLKNSESALKEADDLINTLIEFDSSLIKYMRKLELQLKDKLYNYPQLQERIYPLIEEFKEQFITKMYDEYLWSFHYIDTMHFKHLNDIFDKTNIIKKRFKDN